MLDNKYSTVNIFLHCSLCRVWMLTSMPVHGTASKRLPRMKVSERK